MNRMQQHIAATCDKTLIRCMDWRLGHLMKLYHALEQVYGEGSDFDEVSLAGSCYALVHRESVIQEFFLEQIETSVSLHRSETVVIVQHTECGEYLKRMTFEDEAHERRVLTEDIRDSARILRRRFPKVNVEGFIATLRNDRVVDLGRVQISDDVSSVAETLEHLRA